MTAKQAGRAAGWVASHVIADIIAEYGKDYELTDRELNLIKIANFADKNNLPFHVAADRLREAQ